jgi:hypothetical protein
MRLKTKNYQNQESIDKKIKFFPNPLVTFPDGSLSAKNASEKFSCLGTFKLKFFVFQRCICGVRRAGQCVLHLLAEDEGGQREGL